MPAYITTPLSHQEMSQSFCFTHRKTCTQKLITIRAISGFVAILKYRKLTTHCEHAPTAKSFKIYCCFVPFTLLWPVIPRIFLTAWIVIMCKHFFPIMFSSLQCLSTKFWNTPQMEMLFNIRQHKVSYQNQIPLLCTSSCIDSHLSRQKKCVVVSVATARRQVHHICP